MSPEKQCIAIAEACGWTVIDNILCDPRPLENGDVDLNPTADLPDYLNDLNAMHEAEKTLTADQCYQYNRDLSDITGSWEPSRGVPNWIFHATAAQRAEAFLRTLNKWEESQ